MNPTIPSPPIEFASTGRFDMVRQSRFGFTLVGLLFFLIVVWGGLAQISGAVVAQGRVTVESSVKRVQHREGGIVSEILVHEGQQVTAGQVLVRLDATVADANEASVEEQVWQLKARQMRLQAERDHLGPAVIKVDPSSPSEYKAIVAAERQLMISRASLQEQRKAQYREEITQSEHEITGLEAQVDSQTKQAALITQELVSIKALYAKGYAPFTRVSELQREDDSLEGQRGELIASIAKARAEGSQIRQQILQVDSEGLSDIMTDLKDTETKLGELEQQNITAHDASQRMDLKAPVTGTVQQLAVHTRGGVVAPGDTLMLIVPQADTLVVEAHIDPQKVANVHVGSEAHIHFTGFDTRTTPEAIGRVDTLSTDIETDEKTGASYYVARLTLDGMKLPTAMRQKLVAGMPAEVQIETGRRSALSYFLKPLTDQLHRTFKES